MTANKKTAFALLCLSVILLCLVSARIGQAGAVEISLEEENPEDSEYVLPDTVQVTPAEPEQSPEPTGPVLPEINISDWQYKLVNETYVLSSSFAPDVTEVGDQQYFDARAVDALNAMLEGANAAGYTTCIRTGYRPYSSQAYIFFGKASQIAWDGTVEYAEAEVLARQYVAYPGTSEHQLGLAADIMDRAETSMVAEKVADLPVLVWLKEHCAEYGFILRYPEDKKDITGWYEPWHFRYVGTEAAEFIMENGLCLEEFLALY